MEVSHPITANNSVDKLIVRSIEKVIINNERDITMNFVKDIFDGKTDFGDVLYLPDCYRKEEFMNAII